MKLIKDMCETVKTLHAGLDPFSAITAEIDFFNLIDVIIRVDVFIYFIPKIFVLLSLIRSAEIVCVYQPASLALWAFMFYSFVYIHEFLYCTVQFPLELSGTKISLPCMVLQMYMIFIRFYEQMLHNAFFLGLRRAHFRWEFKRMQMLHYRLLADKTENAAGFSGF